MIRLFESVFTKISFYYMSKGINLLLQFDNDIKSRFAEIDDNVNIKIAILNESKSLKLKKTENNILAYKNKDNCCDYDLIITFKYFKSLPNIVTGKSSVTDSYINNEFFVQGNLRYAVIIVYAIEKFMAYLLPKKIYIKHYGRTPYFAIKKSKMLLKLLFSKRRIVWKIIMSFIVQQKLLVAILL